MKYVKSFMKYKFLLSELVKKGIRLKYRRSYLGILWSLIEPLLTTCVLVMVFGTLFGRQKDFPLYIISGRLIYSYFSSGTKVAAKSIRSNAAMIKKVYVPKYLYPLTGCIYTFVIFLLSLIALVAVDIYCKVVPTWHIVQVFPALLLLFVMTLGFGFILCTLDVFFRDVEYLWNVLLLIIMYMCAIFYYPERLMKSGYAWILKYNPLYHIIDMCRGAFLGYSVGWDKYLYVAAWSVASLVVGIVLFKKKQDEFILHI